MANHVSGKVIVVTGAASGFGRLVCQKTAALGARVVCADVNGGGLDETVRSIEAAGGKATARVTDVRRLGDMQDLAKHAIEQFGAIDVMVNNAGVMPLAFFADHAGAADAWERCVH